jgi:hypothetical protein
VFRGCLIAQFPPRFRPVFYPHAFRADSAEANLPDWWDSHWEIRQGSFWARAALFSMALDPFPRLVSGLSQIGSWSLTGWMWVRGRESK